jgi:hypothetical protein
LVQFSFWQPHTYIAILSCLDAEQLAERFAPHASSNIRKSQHPVRRARAAQRPPIKTLSNVQTASTTATPAAHIPTRQKWRQPSLQRSVSTITGPIFVRSNHLSRLFMIGKTIPRPKSIKAWLFSVTNCFTSARVTIICLISIFGFVLLPVYSALSAFS